MLSPLRLFRHLRPEFVRRYPRPLSADALSNFADPTGDAWEHTARVTEATRVMMTATIPNMVHWLVKRASYAARRRRTAAERSTVGSTRSQHQKRVQEAQQHARELREARNRVHGQRRNSGASVMSTSSTATAATTASGRR